MAVPYTVNFANARCSSFTPVFEDASPWSYKEAPKTKHWANEPESGESERESRRRLDVQILLYLSAAFSVFYFLSTLSMIIYKTHVLSYPVGRLALDVCLLFLMAGLEVLRVYWGLRGNLQESEGYTGLNLIGTGATVLLALYFVIWQSYVLRADVIIGAILICFYGLTGIVGFGTLAGFRRSEFTCL
ncbi:unnamed protein product [Leuciscus chuanchicus]